MWIDQITNRIPGVISIHDDICIYGRNTTGHDKHLLQLMKTALRQGLVFNSSRCNICQSQISFYSPFSLPSARGLIPWRFKPCKTFPPLKWNQTPVILGLIKYLQSFLPSLASKSTFLHEQVTHWDWNPSTDQAFHHLKSWICNTLLRTTLAYYDCIQPLVLQTMPVNMASVMLSSWTTGPLLLLVRPLFILRIDTPI